MWVFMMTSSNGNIFRVTGPLCGEFTSPGEFPTQRPVTRSFDVFFDLRPNKRLSKQSWGWWFETLSRSLWRHCNEKSFYEIHHLLINKSLRNMPIYMSRNLNSRTQRWSCANCVLGNVDLYVLVIAVDGGPIWIIIKLQTAELLGDARSITLVVHQL